MKPCPHHPSMGIVSMHPRSCPVWAAANAALEGAPCRRCAWPILVYPYPENYAHAPSCPAGLASQAAERARRRGAFWSKVWIVIGAIVVWCVVWTVIENTGEDMRRAPNPYADDAPCRFATPQNC